MLKNYKLYFQYLSYLQYPLLVVAIYFAYQPLFYDLSYEQVWKTFNKSLIFIGLGISFSTLQDTTKTQNKLSRIVYQNPIYAKAFIIYLILLTLCCLLLGLYGFLYREGDKINEISLGLIVLGIGILGMLKAALEMAAYHSQQNTAE